MRGRRLVALPADARTREQLEWIAEDVTDNGGDAAIWLGRPADASTEAAITARMITMIAAEYDTVAAEAAGLTAADAATRQRAAGRLRRELHRIQGRDYFPAPSRDKARRAVDALAVTSPARARS